MSVSLQVGFSVLASPTHPTLADGTPSTAVLSAASFASSDPTVFTVAADGVTVVSVGAGTASITGTCTATEADGTVHTISMATPDTVTVTAAPPPPAPQATSFGVAFGTPFATV